MKKISQIIMAVNKETAMHRFQFEPIEVNIKVILKHHYLIDDEDDINSPTT